MLSVSFILFLLFRIAAVLHVSSFFADFAPCFLFVCMFFSYVVLYSMFSSTTFALVSLIIGRQLVELCYSGDLPMTDILFIYVYLLEIKCGTANLQRQR